jgi:light-regulated signal transduction histidine kinase (bacteriophytochrome)
MKIKNLVNKDSVNITNCDLEAIHIPGSIQPFGFLLGVSGDNHLITYCSQNCTEHLCVPVNEILGKELNAFFRDDEISRFTSYYQTVAKELSRPFVFSYRGKSFNTTAHRSGECIVLEFEPFVEDQRQLTDIYIQTRRFAYHTERADNLKTFCQDIADETRLIIGHDRVMIYQFDKDHNGEVIAESKRDGLPPFLNLHYPHTDIPVQARELYLRNLVRMITDVNYTPVPLLAFEQEGKPVPTLDLSLASLRSVSHMHTDYLKNMGVSATFVISLIHNNKLWGLVACHHYSPKYIPYYTRLAAHLQGIFLTSQIDVRQVADEFDLVKDTDKKLRELSEAIAKEEHAVGGPYIMQKIRALLGADGLVLYYREEIFTDGVVPQKENVGPLVKWLFANSKNGIFHTTRLIDHYPEAKGLSESLAGVCFLPLAGDGNNCILWLRHEVQRTINWAGDPAKAVTVDEVSKSVQPRQSFDTWKELVRYQGSEWKKPETDAAHSIGAAIQRRLHLSDLKEEETRYRSLNVKLKKANEELANMNWISTHDLKEPLRKIQIYASVILEKDGELIPQTVRSNVTRMQASAAKMQMLIDDLLAYSKVVNEDRRFVEVDMNLVLEEVKEHLADDVKEKGALLEWGRLPVIKAIHFQIKQLFINLVSNALKFSKTGVQPVVKVTCTEVNGSALTEIPENSALSYYKIAVTDNGMGFDPAYKKDILRIFQRLHSHQYTGTGVGLAICKKIAEAHNGLIEADGEEGTGAVFTLYLPLQNVPVEK